MQDLKVMIESTWHLDEDQTSGSVAARWKRDNVRTGFCSAPPLYTTFTPETPPSSLESFPIHTAVNQSFCDFAWHGQVTSMYAEESRGLCSERGTKTPLSPGSRSCVRLDCWSLQRCGNSAGKI